MRVLLGCEESQTVTKAFRALGHEAYSCDYLYCSGGHPEWHIVGDLRNVVGDGSEWDMAIMFPPCTHLAGSGAKHFDKKREDGSQQAAIDFFMWCWDAVKKIGAGAIENPVGIMSTEFRKPDQIIHPYYFGDPDAKRTCLWLHGLPPIIHAEQDNLFEQKTHVEPEYVTASNGKKYSKIHWMGGGKGKKRSVFFNGVAKAMAEQWSEHLEYVRKVG